MPEYNLASWAIELKPRHIGLNVLEKEFRKLTVPIIGRIENEGFLIDLRTVLEDEIVELASLILGFFGAEKAFQ